jgi:hypothetical protein
MELIAKNAVCLLRQNEPELSHQHIGVSMSAFARMTAPGCTESAPCRCGEEMEIVSIERLPEGSDADVRVYHCRTCHHEMLLTVWAAVAY